MQLFDRIGADAAFRQFSLDSLQSDLFQLVDGDRNVDHLVRMSDGFSNAVQNLAVVYLQRYVNSERPENPFHDLYEFHFAQQRSGADDIHVALVKLPVAAFLRTVGPPDRLYLVAFEREGDFALVLHHITGKRHRQVVTQSLFANSGAVRNSSSFSPAA